MDHHCECCKNEKWEHVDPCSTIGPAKYLALIEKKKKAKKGNLG